MRIFLYFTFTQYQVVLQALALRIFFLVLKSLVRLPRTRDLFQRFRHFLTKVCKRSLKIEGAWGKFAGATAATLFLFYKNIVFPVYRRPTPEKLCDFYWLQLQITCKSGRIAQCFSKEGKSKLTAQRRTKTQGCALTAQNLAQGD